MARVRHCSQLTTVHSRADGKLRRCFQMQSCFVGEPSDFPTGGCSTSSQALLIEPVVLAAVFVEEVWSATLPEDGAAEVSEDAGMPGTDAAGAASAAEADSSALAGALGCGRAHNALERLLCALPSGVSPWV